MGIVGALDVHRKQITFKWQDTDSGEIGRGRIAPACRDRVREWLAGFDEGTADFVLEGGTGWRFVVEELRAAGHAAHLADPAETAALRGPKRRAKTDRADCDHMLELLAQGRVPESWIPPAHILELRARVRLRKALVDERKEWSQRIHAQLFHQGVPPGIKPRTALGRARLAEAHLSPAGREVVELGLRMMDRIDQELLPIERHLTSFADRQRGCRALMEALYGVGPIVSTAILAELGDCRRFASSDDAVRHSGLDVTVYDSDGKRARGHLSHQGPEVLRWALYEAASSAARQGSPDHAYYLTVKDRIDATRAFLSVGRRLCRRAHHILRSLGEGALAPPPGAVGEAA